MIRTPELFGLWWRLAHDIAAVGGGDVHPFARGNMRDCRVRVLRSLGTVLVGAALMSVCSCSTTRAMATDSSAGVRQRMRIDADWRFHPGDIAPTDAVIRSDYADGSWKHI